MDSLDPASNESPNGIPVPAQWAQPVPAAAPVPWPAPVQQTVVLMQQQPAIRPRPAVRTDVPPFFFNGGAGTYLGTALLAALITVFTLGICFPFALVLHERWKAKHTYIEGRRLMFTGTGMGLFGNWIKWWLLIIITFGIFSFWVGPKIQKWKTEKQAFDPRG